MEHKRYSRLGWTPPIKIQWMLVTQCVPLIFVWITGIKKCINSHKEHICCMFRYCSLIGFRLTVVPCSHEVPNCSCFAECE